MKFFSQQRTDNLKLLLLFQNNWWLMVWSHLAPCKIVFAGSFSLTHGRKTKHAASTCLAKPTGRLNFMWHMTVSEETYGVKSVFCSVGAISVEVRRVFACLVRLWPVLMPDVQRLNWRLLLLILEFLDEVNKLFFSSRSGGSSPTLACIRNATLSGHEFVCTTLTPTTSSRVDATTEERFLRQAVCEFFCLTPHDTIPDECCDQQQWKKNAGWKVMVHDICSATVGSERSDCKTQRDDLQCVAVAQKMEEGQIRRCPQQQVTHRRSLWGPFISNFKSRTEDNFLLSLKPVRLGLSLISMTCPVRTETIGFIFPVQDRTGLNGDLILVRWKDPAAVSEMEGGGSLSFRRGLTSVLEQENRALSTSVKRALGVITPAFLWQRATVPVVCHWDLHCFSFVFFVGFLDNIVCPQHLFQREFSFNRNAIPTHMNLTMDVVLLHNEDHPGSLCLASDSGHHRVLSCFLSRVCRSFCSGAFCCTCVVDSLSLTTRQQPHMSPHPAPLCVQFHPICHITYVIRWSYYEGVSTSAFQKMVMIPFKFNGIMTTFWKAEVDTPSYPWLHVASLTECSPAPSHASCLTSTHLVLQKNAQGMSHLQLPWALLLLLVGHLEDAPETKCAALIKETSTGQIDKCVFLWGFHDTVNTKHNSIIISADGAAAERDPGFVACGHAVQLWSGHQRDWLHAGVAVKCCCNSQGFTQGTSSDYSAASSSYGALTPK